MKRLSWLLFRLLYASIILLVAGLAWMWWFAWHESTPILDPVVPELADSPLKPESYPGITLEYFDFIGSDGFEHQACFARFNEKSDLTPAQLKIIDSLKSNNLNPPPAGYVLVATEWKKGISSSLAQAEMLAAAGFSCILWDSDPKEPSKANYCSHGLREHKDIPLLLNAATEKVGKLGPIMALGHGYGASLLIQAAAIEPRIRNLVAINPFATLKKVVQAKELENHGKLASYFTFFLIDAGLSLRADYRSFQVAPVAAASDLNIPTMLACTEEYVYAEPQDIALIYNAIESPQRSIYVPRGEAPVSQTNREFIIKNHKQQEVKNLEPIQMTLYQDKDELNKLSILWLHAHTSNPMPRVIIGEEFLPNKPSTQTN